MSANKETAIKKFWFAHAWLPDGWADDVVVSAQNEVVVNIQVNQPNIASGVERIEGCLIPGMTNVHSHAFQRAMAGLAEYRTSQHDSFWTWRKLMYEFLERFTPDDIFEIGKSLYLEMLERGYTSVVEFHYLLQRPDGTPYDNINAMADVLILAALDVGIDICMLPVYYQRGGFDDSPLAGGQRRFGTTREQFLMMLEKLKADWSNQPSVRLGYAIHSLRAVSIPAAQTIVAEADLILPGCPIHIHVAEQTKEIDDCLATHGKRPVELLLDSFDVNQRWCLIHATHMNDDELQNVANSGAVIGVCPSTEANLGDGIFRADDFLKAGGRLAIGGDSHVAVDVRAELRMIEYAQRLTTRRRAVLCSDHQSCGSLLYQWTATGGGQASGFGDGAIQVGQRARFSVIEGWNPNAATDRLIDQAIFQESPRSPTIRCLVLRTQS